jgi:putative sigma-54 modulation protein
MKIDISGRHHFAVSDMLREYALEKMDKLDRYSLNIESAHVVFEQEKVNQTCEIVLSGKHLRLTAKETTKAMQASLDAAVKHLQDQLRRHHDRIKQHRHEKIRIDSYADEVES